MKKDLSILLYESKLLLVLFFRDRQSIFWTYLFPSGLLILFSSLFGRGKSSIDGGMLTSVIAISVMAGGIFGIGMSIVSAREAGIFKRYKTTPLSSWIILASHLLTRTVTVFSTLVLLVSISVFGFGVQLKGDVAAVIVVVCMGISTFSALGFLIAGFAKTAGTALSISNMLYMIMLFIGGMFPVAILPPLMQKVAMFLPVTHFWAAMYGIMVEGKSLFLAETLKSLGILTLFLFIFSAAAVHWFKWERES